MPSTTLSVPTGPAFGTIVPSSNRTIERVTAAVLRDHPDVSGHFARLRHVGTTDAFPDDYDWDGMLDAARLLGHAELDVIAWNGSKGGVIGLDKDRELAGRIAKETGARSTTSSLALDRRFSDAGIRRIAFVTPFTAALNTRIAANWEKAGYACVAMRGAELRDNFSFSQLGPDPIRAMALEVAQSDAEAIVLYCTNMQGATVAAELTQATGRPVHDSVSVCVAECLQMLGIDTTPSAAWGPSFARAT